MPELPNRRSIRLSGYDYTRPGAYFLTICAKGGLCLFGEVVGEEMQVNAAGRMVQQAWDQLPQKYLHVRNDAFVVMPNHVHGIVILTEVPADLTSKTLHPLSEVVRRFKTDSARAINQLRQTPGISVWKRNYYEQIIRNPQSLDRIRNYISNNPKNWHQDRENPAARF